MLAVIFMGRRWWQFRYCYNDGKTVCRIWWHANAKIDSADKPKEINYKLTKILSYQKRFSSFTGGAISLWLTRFKNSLFFSLSFFFYCIYSSLIVKDKSDSQSIRERMQLGQNYLSDIVRMAPFNGWTREDACHSAITREERQDR